MASMRQDIPRPEHPRPIFMREPWVNLNGPWRFSFDPADIGEQVRWYRVTHPEIDKALASTDSSSVFNTGPSSTALTEDPYGDEIIVPFPWESRLSSICEPTYKGVAWYQRVIEVPADWAIEDRPAGPRDASGLLPWKIPPPAPAPSVRR